MRLAKVQVSQGQTSRSGKSGRSRCVGAHNEILSKIRDPEGVKENRIHPKWFAIRLISVLPLASDDSIKCPTVVDLPPTTKIIS
jgi:hypothetical protein